VIGLLADESLPRPSVARLREAGFDVTSARSGASDDEVLARAAGEHRVLVTLDRDFGRLAFFSRNAMPLGVVYLRPRGRRPEAAAELLLSVLLDPRIELEGRFTTVREANVRQRILPRRS
jgi:predicted nuclease of predicted toxin-antitoxin system